MADERGSGKGSVFMFGQSSGAHGREHLGKCAFLVIPAKPESSSTANRQKAGFRLSPE
jgi:hypothetical protein